MASYTVEEVIDLLDEDVGVDEPICEGSDDDFQTEEEVDTESDDRQDDIIYCYYYYYYYLFSSEQVVMFSDMFSASVPSPMSPTARYYTVNIIDYTVFTSLVFSCLLSVSPPESPMAWSPAAPASPMALSPAAK